MSQNRLFEYFKTDIKQNLEVLVCEDSKEADELYSVVKFFNKEAIVFPDFRACFGDDLRVYKEELHKLFYALKIYYAKDKKPLIISPLKTLLFNLPDYSLFQSKKLSLVQI